MVKPNGSNPRVPKKSSRNKPLPLSEMGAEMQILSAARSEFIAKGFSGARMQAIAIKAGVNKALLHYYFRSKSKLYETVLRNILQSVWTKIREDISLLGPTTDLESLVRAIVSTYIRTLAANPDFPLVMIHELASGGEFLQPLAKDLWSDMEQVPTVLLKALAREKKAGIIQNIDPVHFIMNMIGMCMITFLAMPVLKNMGPNLGLTLKFDEKFFEERINAIVSTIFMGLRKPR